MRLLSLPVVVGALLLTGCSGEKGPEGADSMEAELQKAAQSTSQKGGEWKPRSAGTRANGGQRPDPAGTG